MPEVTISTRRHTIDYHFHPGQPCDERRKKVEREFAELGWKVIQYSGSSNLHRVGIDIESSSCELDHATLIATLAKLDVPLSSDPFTGTHLYGDVAMKRCSVAWETSHQATVEDVRVEIQEVELLDRKEWFYAGEKGLVPVIGLTCRVGPSGPAPPRFPVEIAFGIHRPDGKSLGGSSGPLWRTGPARFTANMSDVTPMIDLDVRILDIHRAGEIMFRSVPVSWKVPY